MRTRAIASVAVAALVVLGTSACNFVTPQATLKQYDPSNGTSVTVGDVKVVNALVLTEDGEQANLIASVVNMSDSRVQLKLQYQSGSDKVDTKFSIGARETKNLGSNGGLELTLENIDAMPGDLLPLYLQYGNVEGKQVMVPVLDGALPEYTDLLP